MANKACSLYRLSDIFRSSSGRLRSIKRLNQIDKDHGCNLFLTYCLKKMTSDVQTSCLCRVEKSITTLMTSKFLFLKKISHKLDGAAQYVWRSSQSLPPECLQSWLKFNFAGMPAVKLCDGSSCRRRMFSFVREVSPAVPAATSSRASGWASTRRMETNRNICYRVFLQKREFILRGTHKY